MPNDDPTAYKPITWNPIFEMGHSAIDDDHRSLIEKTNTLLEMIAVDSGIESGRIISLVQVMREECYQHFASEEQVMKTLSFAGVNEHVKEHRRVEEVIDGFLDRLRELPEWGTEFREHVLAFRMCLLDHMLRYDLKYKSHFMNEAGY